MIFLQERIYVFKLFHRFMHKKSIHLSKIPLVVLKHLSKAPHHFLIWREGAQFLINRSGTKTSNFKQTSASSSTIKNLQPIRSQFKLDFDPSKMEKIKSLVSENGVVIFTKSTCCLCYAVKILFQELGVSPVVHEIDQDPHGRDMEKALLKQGCNSPPVPAVYICGKLVGSTNEVMSLHLSGSLIPLLKPFQSLS